METKSIMAYDVRKSADRMDDILNEASSAFTAKGSIPSREALTYNNGYYVNVVSLFIDMVGSSNLTEKHDKPTLAKIYRCFISECIAIMNSEDLCKEINIVGDCVGGIFDMSNKEDINKVILVAAKLNGMIKILNHKLKEKGYLEISAGIGIDVGQALMVKAGYSQSGINDIIWMGDVVNSACHLCNGAGRNGRKTVVLSEGIYDSLDVHIKSQFNSFYNGTVKLYEGNIVDGAMEEW